MKARTVVWTTLGAVVVSFALGFFVAFKAKRVSVAVDVPYDRIEALLAAASLTLFFATILISLLGIFGWHEIKNVVTREVERLVRKESLGNIKLTTGLFYGRMCRIDSDDGFEVNHPDLLRSAIGSTRDALQLLRGTPIEIKAKNNLAFYLALKTDPIYGREAVGLAEELHVYGSQTENLTMLNTYGAVVAAYSTYFPDPGKALREARDLLQAITERENVDPMEKKNARRHIIALNQALSKEVKKS